MRGEDFNLIAQLVEAMDLTFKELEKGLEKNNAEKINKAKQEILKFQQEIAKILG